MQDHLFSIYSSFARNIVIILWHACFTVFIHSCIESANSSGQRSSSSTKSKTLTSTTPNAIEDGLKLSIEKSWLRKNGPTDIEYGEIIYGRGLKGDLKGVYIRPRANVYNGPTIVAVHNDWGLSKDFLQMLTRIVAANYQILAVNLYELDTPPKTQEEADAAMKALRTKNDAETNIYGASDFLFKEKGASEIILMGWGTGGEWVINSLIKFPNQYKVAINFYGGYSKIAQFATTLKPYLTSPSMHLLPAADPNLPLDKLRGIPNMLQDVANPTLIKFYENDDYGFFEPYQSGYINTDAKIALDDVLKFILDNTTRTN